MKRDLVLVGAITGAHGIRGEVKLKSFTADPAAIASYSPLETAYISRENGVSTPGVAVGAREGSAAALAGTLGAVTGDDPPAVAGEAVLPVVAVAVPVPVRANVVGITVTARSQ